MLGVSWLVEKLAVSERQTFGNIEKFTGLIPNKSTWSLKLCFEKELLWAKVWEALERVFKVKIISVILAIISNETQVNLNYQSH